MKFSPLPLAGAFLVSLEKRCDERGAFARAYCRDEFRQHGVDVEVVQSNISTNHRAGTVRGMHYQRPPHAEVKFIRCTQGAIYDVIVDVREGSPTFGQWYGIELSAENGLLIIVPQGFAHGYQALTDGATVFYMVSAPYVPNAEGGLRYDDPGLAISWPLPVVEVSMKDKQWPELGSHQIHRNGE